MIKLEEIRRIISKYPTKPIVQFLAKTPIAPDTITWLGFLIAIAAAVTINTGNLLIAGGLVLFAGFFDTLDGALARITNRVTRFGAILDSTLDRFSEAVLLLAILVLYAREQLVAECLLVGITLFASLMVSYIRARAETLGIECKVGIFTRPERVIVLALGLLLSWIDYAMVAALVIITVFSFFTIGQRLLYTWRQTKGT